MESKTLKKIINQIKKYNLTELFSDEEELKNWIFKLNSTQIKNFLALDIEYEEIKNLKHLLINNELLNCKDYKEKVVAISTLKNGDGCWHLFDVICNPNFLKSKNFYKDIELLRKADTARYALWVLGEDSFINSPYHDEDLKLIVDAHDTNKENPLDFVVSDALATVARNIDSIKSPYHEKDMKLISIVGSKCLQMSHSYPESSINNLAINKVSLSDKYHLENMQILATNPIAREFLYMLMTNPDIINGKYYRLEIEALLNAKSRHTARALYYYIANPRNKFNMDYNFYDDFKHDINDAIIKNSEYVSVKDNPDYINNLTKINQINDNFVMQYVSLLMNPNFINSPYKNFDLELLQSICSKPILMDLYILMSDTNSLNSNYHTKDVSLISKTEDDVIRNLLLKKAICECSVNHEYDMEYISKLKIDSISENIFDELFYYLFNQEGIVDINHKEKLGKILEEINSRSTQDIGLIRK